MRKNNQKLSTLRHKVVGKVKKKKKQKKNKSFLKQKFCFTPKKTLKIVKKSLKKVKFKAKNNVKMKKNR